MNPVNAISKPYSTNQKTPDFQLVEGNIRFLKKLPGMIVSLSEDNGENKTVKIYCYSNIIKIRNDFNFHNNGFQYCALKNDLLELINQFIIAPSGSIGRKNRPLIMICAAKFLSSWGRENGIKGVAVPLNLNYRSADRSDCASAPFFFAHADYDKNDIANTMQINKGSWKCNIEKVTGALSEQQYLDLKIYAMVNLWMPLNELPTVNTLALMDISSSENLFEELLPAITPGNNTSLGLEAGVHQKWVAQTVMTLGSGVIFNSMKTPHTAVDIEGRLEEQQCDEYRRSLEGRFIYIELPN